ncbi:flagellar assembly protein FliW [uncultured Clostridium sp.]|uniref:flagellar assembly protein FliW n=1 Tax=uncultured Clostridium sp. TaxID=59620 RepID=UPI0028E4F316|nr:flagellar assembly protein FliW [uncultured Clostridium sp.]
MKLNTKHHGILEYKEEDVVLFPKGVPGFSELKKFIIFPVEGEGIFSILHSIEEETIGLAVVSPFSVCKDYEFQIPEETIKNLKVNSPEDILVITTVTINSHYKMITTNLRAPIIINIKGKIGEQIILENEEYKIKHPIFQEEK